MNKMLKYSEHKQFFKLSISNPNKNGDNYEQISNKPIETNRIFSMIESNVYLEMNAKNEKNQPNS